MNREPGSTDPREDAWHRTLRRLALYSWGLFAAAVVVALAGSAVIAWLLAYMGMPFLGTWLIIATIILLVPLVAMAVRREKGG